MNWTLIDKIATLIVELEFSGDELDHDVEAALIALKDELSKASSIKMGWGKLLALSLEKGDK